MVTKAWSWGVGFTAATVIGAAMVAPVGVYEVSTQASEASDVANAPVQQNIDQHTNENGAAVDYFSYLDQHDVHARSAGDFHVAAAQKVRKWPKRKITLRVKLPTKTYRKGFLDAVKAWNSHKLKVKFKVVKSKKADVQVVHDPSIGSAGLANLGYFPNIQARVWMNTKSKERRTTALVASHELGHILGLQHRKKGCSVMRTDNLLHEQGCDARFEEFPFRGWWYRCRLQERKDLKTVKRMYGGKFKLSNPANCLQHPAAQPVSNVATTLLRGSDFVQLTWPASANAAKYTVQRGDNNGTCPTELESPYTGGAELTYRDWDSPDRFGESVCYSLWSFNEDGYPTGPTNVVVTHEELPVPLPVNPTVSAQRTKEGWQVDVNAGADDDSYTVYWSRQLGSCPMNLNEASSLPRGGRAFTIYEGWGDGKSGDQVCVTFWNSEWTGSSDSYSAPVHLWVTLP